jgi:hypothetical protein
MFRRAMLTAAAAVIALTTVSVSPAPSQAFGEQPFVTMFNANVGVIQRKFDAMPANPTWGQLTRMLREVARAENRIVYWLQTHPPTACQRPWVAVMVRRGVTARKSWKAGARAIVNGNYGQAETLVVRGARFHLGMVNAGNGMVSACP